MAQQMKGVGIIGTGRRGYDLGMCIIDLKDKTGLEIRALNNRTRIRMEEAETPSCRSMRIRKQLPISRCMSVVRT